VSNVTTTHTISGVGGPAGGSSSAGGSGQFGYHIITPSAGVATIDINALGGTTTCFCFRLVLNATAVSIPAPIWTGGTIVAGLKIWLYIFQDSTGHRAMPTFAHAATGDFGNEVASQQIFGVASTMSVFQMTYHGTRWLLDVQTCPTGLATS
jgi:hypothetical protein